MNEKIDIDRIRNSLDNYPILRKIIGKINNVKTIYNFPYKQDKSIYEWNLFGILNSEDFSEELIEGTIEQRNKIKADRVLDFIVVNSCLSEIIFKKKDS